MIARDPSGPVSTIARPSHGWAVGSADRSAIRNWRKLSSVSAKFGGRLAPITASAPSRSRAWSLRMKSSDIETSSNRAVRIGGTVTVGPLLCGWWSGVTGRAVREVLQDIELGDDPDRTIAAGRDHGGRAVRQHDERLV